MTTKFHSEINTQEKLSYIITKDMHKNAHTIETVTGTIQMPINRRMDKLWHYHTMEYYTIVKTKVVHLNLNI